ncbi:MAG: hypothetical protein ACR2O6_15245 [Ilumatobacteraceae bacterium]
MGAAAARAQPVPTGRRATRSKTKRPQLPPAVRRRRWPAILAGLALALVMAGMLGAAVFHTQLAGRQLEIDRLEREVNVERERFDQLRHERATLRSPARLAEAAAELGMVRGSAGTFVGVDSMVLARQLAAAGAVDLDDDRIIAGNDPLEQFRDVKSVSAGQP